jgi:hypothetical protein
MKASSHRTFRLRKHVMGALVLLALVALIATFSSLRHFRDAHSSTNSVASHHSQPHHSNAQGFSIASLAHIQPNLIHGVNWEGSHAHTSEEALLRVRRNHVCLSTDRVAPDGSTSTWLYQIGGRWEGTIEGWEIATGRREIHATLAKEQENHFPLSHASIQVVPPLSDRHGKPTEIWHICGFTGWKVETKIPNITIVELYTWRAWIGPSIDVPRGSCTSFQLERPLRWFKVSPHNPPHLLRNRSMLALDRTTAFPGRLVCAIGGVDHHEVRPTADIRTVSCFDRLEGLWWSLPDLPRTNHHHMVGERPANVCYPGSPPQLLVLNSRTAHGFGGSNNTMTALDLDDEDADDVHSSSERSWEVLEGSATMMTAIESWLSPSGRYVMFTGGNSFSFKRTSMYSSQTYVLDMCRRTICLRPEAASFHVKWATTACTTPDRKVAFVCGGDAMAKGITDRNTTNFQIGCGNRCVATDKRNTGSCDLFDSQKLIDACNLEGDASEATGAGWNFITRTLAKAFIKMTIRWDLPIDTKWTNMTMALRHLEMDVPEKL